MKKNIISQMMFSARLNDRQTMKALSLGFNLKFQGKKELKEKNERNISKVGKKALRLNLHDSSGNIITVGGNLLFKGHPKGKVENLSPRKSLQDLCKLGYKFLKIHLFQKEGQDFGFLRVYMSKDVSSPLTITPDQVLFLKTHFLRDFRTCTGFIHLDPENDPPNVTFNFGGPITSSTELKEKKEDLKIII